MTKKELEYILERNPEIVIEFIREHFFEIFSLDFNDFSDKINKR